MTAEEPLVTEDAFFEALVKADAGLLGTILAEDFLIVDIMRGDVTGRTQMSGASGDAEFTVASRYTHVFVQAGTGDWKLVSAQGTSIAG